MSYAAETHPLDRASIAHALLPPVQISNSPPNPLEAITASTAGAVAAAAAHVTAPSIHHHVRVYSSNSAYASAPPLASGHAPLDAPALYGLVAPVLAMPAQKPAAPAPPSLSAFACVWVAVYHLSLALQV